MKAKILLQLQARSFPGEIRLINSTGQSATSIPGVSNPNSRKTDQESPEDRRRGKRASDSKRFRANKKEWIEELEDKCTVLKATYTKLKEEKAGLIAERDMLKAELSQASQNHSEEGNASSTHGTRNTTVYDPVTGEMLESRTSKDAVYASEIV
ncbi:hypothetical protein L204_104688 [Cryptococcus depauperatus]